MKTLLAWVAEGLGRLGTGLGLDWGRQVSEVKIDTFCRPAGQSNPYQLYTAVTGCDSFDECYSEKQSKVRWSWRRGEGGCRSTRNGGSVLDTKERRCQGDAGGKGRGRLGLLLCDREERETVRGFRCVAMRLCVVWRWSV